MSSFDLFVVGARVLPNDNESGFELNVGEQIQTSIRTCSRGKARENPPFTHSNLSLRTPFSSTIECCVLHIKLIPLVSDDGETLDIQLLLLLLACDIFERVGRRVRFGNFLRERPGRMGKKAKLCRDVLLTPAVRHSMPVLRQMLPARIDIPDSTTLVVGLFHGHNMFIFALMFSFTSP